jgi:hypothetical protein
LFLFLLLVIFIIGTVIGRWREGACSALNGSTATGVILLFEVTPIFFPPSLLCL